MDQANQTAPVSGDASLDVGIKPAPISSKMALAVSSVLTALALTGGTVEVTQLDAIKQGAIADNRTEMFAAAPVLEARDVANPDIGDAGCKAAATVMAKDSTYYIDTVLLAKLREQNALLVAAHTPVLQIPPLRVEARDMRQCPNGASILVQVFYQLGDSIWPAKDTVPKITPEPPEGQVSDVWLQLGHSDNAPRVIDTTKVITAQ